MNSTLVGLIILTLHICGPDKHTLSENLDITKPTSSEKTELIKFKKVPTKWVKITKKSN